jgi:hypothetical protein
LSIIVILFIAISIVIILTPTISTIPIVSIVLWVVVLPKCSTRHRFKCFLHWIILHLLLRQLWRGTWLVLLKCANVPLSILVYQTF